MHGCLKRSAAVLLVLWGVGLVQAAGPPSEVESCATALIPRLPEGPSLDGKLDDASWENTAILGPFVTIVGGEAKHKTTARVFHDGVNLYVGVHCAMPPGTAPQTEHTKRDSEVYSDECIEIFIDPGLSFSKYFHVLVNAANVQRDEKGDLSVSPTYDKSWDAQWRSAVSRQADAWTVELALPLTTFGLDSKEGRLLGLNVCRNDKAAAQNTCWSPTISGFHVPARFGAVGLSATTGAGVKLTVRHPAKVGLAKVEAEATLEGPEGSSAGLRGKVVFGNESGTSTHTFRWSGKTAKVWYRLPGPGVNAVVIAAVDKQERPVALAKHVITLPRALNRTYGYRLPGNDELGLWWAESTYKIHRWKKRPVVASNTVRVSAAGGEYEAVQLVVRPAKDVTVSLRVSDFQGPGSVIPGRYFEIYQVAYVPVNIPTDKFGWVDDWPDPIAPVAGPVACKAEVNQPFWVLAHVPAGAKSGIYRGRIELDSGEEKAIVPVELEVYGFSLTAETHTRTAYGVSPAYSFLGIKDEADKRYVYDLYMQNCRDHRICPYTPMRHYRIKTETKAPSRTYSYGKLRLEFQVGRQNPWTLYWDGEQAATQRTSMTHFEKKGVGYKGQGVNWPYVNTIESIEEVSRSDSMRVLEVVAAHTGSRPASRSFKLTFRFFVPSGGNWFAMKLVRMESTDPVEVTVRNYFNLPKTTFKAKQTANGKDYAAWSDDKVGFGMLCLGGGCTGMRIKKGGAALTVGNGVTPFKIKQGGIHDGWGPLVVYFLSEDRSSKGLAARAEALAKLVDVADPAKTIPGKRAPVAEQVNEEYGFTHDFAEFDKGARRYLDEFRFNAFRFPCMPGRIAGRGRFAGDYERLHRLSQGPIIEHLRENGWLKLAYSYWFDEPNEKQYAMVVQGMTILKENCPGLTRLLTEQPEDELIGAVDLWTPVLSHYDAKRCHERQEAGDQVWWYVCCGPRAPYPNNFVDHPAINHRIRFWMAEKFGVTGSLYWATTFYGKTPDGVFRNPWKDGMTYRPSGGYWGNGDGMLLYPACKEKSDTPTLKGPVSSIRWECLRDGIEDREYFWTLRQELERLRELRKAGNWRRRRAIDRALARAEEALASPDRLADSLVKYTKDPQDLLRERTALATAIEACRRIR